MLAHQPQQQRIVVLSSITQNTGTQYTHTTLEVFLIRKAKSAVRKTDLQPVADICSVRGSSLFNSTPLH